MQHIEFNKKYLKIFNLYCCVRVNENKRDKEIL